MNKKQCKQIIMKLTIVTHCVKSVLLRSFCGPYFPAFRLSTERYISPYLVRMRKKEDQKNSEYGHLLRSKGNLDLLLGSMNLKDIGSFFCLLHWYTYLHHIEANQLHNVRLGQEYRDGFHEVCSHFL